MTALIFFYLCAICCLIYSAMEMNFPLWDRKLENQIKSAHTVCGMVKSSVGLNGVSSLVSWDATKNFGVCLHHTPVALDKVNTKKWEEKQKK